MNQVVDALSQRTFLLMMMTNKFIQFELVKNMYEINKDFYQVMGCLRSLTTINVELYREYFL